MTTPLYSIARWLEIYEGHDNGRLKGPMPWIKLPTKQDGLSFRRMAAHRDRADLFSAFILMLEIAARQTPECRGQLIRAGQPLTAEDLSTMTGWPATTFTKAFEFFSDPSIGWLLVNPLGMTADPASLAQAKGSPGVTAPPHGVEMQQPSSRTQAELLQFPSVSVAGLPHTCRTSAAGMRQACGLEERRGEERRREENIPRTGVREGAGGEVGKNDGSLAQKSRETRFQPPLLDEWQRYGQTLYPPWPIVEADNAFDHYVANGWKVGKNPVKDWRACVRTCHRNWQQKQNTPDARRRAPVQSNHAAGL